jgi:hypothetical protein
MGMILSDDFGIISLDSKFSIGSHLLAAELVLLVPKLPIVDSFQ